MSFQTSRRVRRFVVSVKRQGSEPLTYPALAEHSVDVIADALDRHGLEVRLSVRPWVPMERKAVQA